MPRQVLTTYERAAKAADRLFEERKSFDSITAHTLRTACGGRGDHSTFSEYLERWKVERRLVTAETAIVQFIDPFWRDAIDDVVGRIVQAAVSSRTRELIDDNHRLRTALSKEQLDSDRLRAEIKDMGGQIDRLSGGPRSAR